MKKSDAFSSFGLFVDKQRVCVRSFDLPAMVMPGKPRQTNPFHQCVIAIGAVAPARGRALGERKKVMARLC